MHRVRLGGHLALAGLLSLAGCSCNSKPAPPAVGGAGSPPAATHTDTGTPPPVVAVPPRAPPREVARAAVLELYETHHDTFPALALGESHEGAAAASGPQIALTPAGLVIDPALVGEAAAGARQAAGLELAADMKSLDQVRFVVVRHVLYRGEAREGSATRYLAFAALPATVDLPKRYPAGDRWEFEIAADGPLPLAARAVAAYPPEAAALQLAAGPQPDRLTLTLAGKATELVRGQPAELFSGSRSVTVVERPIVADFIEPGGGETGVVVVPAIEHGPITFETRLAGVYWGERPLYVGALADAATLSTPAAPGKEPSR